MTDTVEVSLRLPNGYREAILELADIAGIPFDHAIAFILATHIVAEARSVNQCGR